MKTIQTGITTFLEQVNPRRTNQNLRKLLLNYIQSDTGDLADMALDLERLFDLMDIIAENPNRKL